MRAGAGICVVAMLLALPACTDDSSDGGPNGDATASASPSEPGEASAECVATGEAVLDAMDAVVAAHRDEPLRGFLAALGEAPALSSELDLSPDDVNCDQGTAFALAFEEAQEIPSDTPTAFLAKALLIGEFGQRLTFGSDWGPNTPVEAPAPVGEPLTFKEAERALDGADACNDVAAYLAGSMQAALDATAQLSLPQFFGVEPGGERINPFVVDAVGSALKEAKGLGCSQSELWQRSLVAMSNLRTQGFTPHVALGAFVQLEIYPRVYAALGAQSR